MKLSANTPLKYVVVRLGSETHRLVVGLSGYRCILIIVLCLWGSLAIAQSPTAQRKALRKERKALLRRIGQIQKILSQTTRRQRNSTGRLSAINQQVSANEELVTTIQQEIQVINQEIVQKRRTIGTLTREHTQLQKEYATMVYLGAKAMHNIHTLMFIFSATSFHALVQRIRYVRQYAQVREKHFREIRQVVATLQIQQQALKQRQQAKKTLLHTQQTEQHRLEKLKRQQTGLLSSLRKQHAKLHKELQQRNRAVKRLDRLAKDIIQRAEAPAPKTPPTPEATPSTPPKAAPRTTPPADPPKSAPAKKPQYKKLSAAEKKQLTQKFRQHKKKLLWPVKEGFISSKFGISKHPVLQRVEVENLGIDIQTKAGATVHAIFEGVVKTIAFIPGMNRVVIIQHGNYHSVYARLKQTSVVVGQYVAADTPLGILGADAQGTTALQLQIWHHTNKLNPARWLKRKP